MTTSQDIEVIANIEPKRVWDFFAGLAAVPRPSKHEEKIQAHVIDLAGRLGFKHRRDRAGNIVLQVPATSGYENAPIVVLQGHLDMVAEKNTGVVHDFLNDPIRLVLDTDADTGREIVRAQGTTLGADNGIGVALALAAATDPDVTHGPLELLLTSDEEMGMTGANALAPDFINGRILINLDSEDEDSIYIGCAGGADVTLHWNVALTPADPALQSLRINVSGLRGGHSGGDIHLNRANAIKLLAQTLDGANDLRVVTMTGGSKRNAIPREASADVLATLGEAKALAAAAAEVQLRARRTNGEADCRIEVTTLEAQTQAAVSAEDSQALIRSLLAAPSGVLAVVPEIHGLVQTSNNISTIVSESSGSTLRIRVGCLTRSSSADDIAWATRQVRAAGDLAGAETRVGNQYPGWQPNPDSKLLALCTDVYIETFESEPNIKAVHAGLECGIIGERIGGMEMVSFGPDIRGAHSPDERVFIDSVAKMYRYLAAVLRRLAGTHDGTDRK